MTTTVLIYRSGQSYALQTPPNVDHIDQAEGGTIFTYFDAERNTTYQYIVVEYPEGKAVSPYDGANILRYEGGKEYLIRAYPHISTMDDGALFRWGDLRMIAVDIQGKIFIESYTEQIPGWPIGSIWSEPSQISEQVDVNWLEAEQWSPGNTGDWATWGISDFTYRNFAGINGLTLLVFREGQAFVGANLPQRVDNGFEFTIDQGNFHTFTFQFLTPIELEFDLEVETADATLRTLSGLFRLESIRNPRYQKAIFESVDLFGPFDNRMETLLFAAVPTPPNSPGRLPPNNIKIDGACDGISVFIDNQEFSSDTTIRFLNWRLKRIDLGKLYQVEFDAVEGGYSGRPLEGSQNVVLTDQHINGGWMQLEDSVFEMDYAPTVSAKPYGRTLGFFRGESVWGTSNDTLYWCADDNPAGPTWFPQNVSALSHPFENLVLRTYPFSSGDVETKDVLSAANKGLYLLSNRRSAASFTANTTNLSIIDDRVVGNYPFPSINMSVDGNYRPSITLDTGELSPDFILQKYSFVLTSYASVDERPAAGVNIINVAKIADVYYAIVFDGNGNIAADRNGADFTTDATYISFADAWLPFLAQGVSLNQPTLNYFKRETFRFLGLGPFGSEEPLGITLKALSVPNSVEIAQGNGGPITLIPGVGRGNGRSCGDVLLRFDPGHAQARRGSLVFDLNTGFSSRFVRFPNTFPSVNTVLQVSSVVTNPDGSRTAQIGFTSVSALQADQQIIRSENPPTISTTKPTWEEWIQETATSLRRFTHGLVGNEYIPLPIPWYSTYDAQQNKMVPHYELLKPAAPNP